MSVLYDIYLAGNGPEQIDWSSPTASVAGGTAAASISVHLEPGLAYVLAARARSGSGRQEQNKNVLCRFEIDSSGRITPWQLAAPRELTASIESAGTVRVNFSVSCGAGYARPDRFEILTDGGTGRLNQDMPAAVIENFPEDRNDFSMTLSVSVLPAIFAIRPSREGKPGPISRIVHIVGTAAPLPVMLF